VLSDPLTLALVRTAALLTMLGGLIVLLLRMLAAKSQNQRIRLLFTMVVVAAAIVAIDGTAAQGFEFVAAGLAVGVLGGLALISNSFDGRHRGRL
jgi:hypothetical protein